LGLCGVVILCREGWRRDCSHITCEFLVSITVIQGLNYFEGIYGSRIQSGATSGVVVRERVGTPFP